MDIARILELDKASRELVRQARKSADRIETDTPVRVKQLRDDSYKQANEAIADFEADQNKMADGRIEQINRGATERLTRLNEQYEQKSKEWISHIVSRVTEGE